MSHFVTSIMDYPGFRGLYFACLFSGSLSTLSTVFNSVASIVWEDWLKKIVKHCMTKRQQIIFIKMIGNKTRQSKF